MQELKWSIMKKPGGVLLITVTSCEKEPNQIPDAFVYERKFKRMLEPFRPITRIDLIVNSPGGAVNSALGMTKALADEKRPIRCLIDGQCGSAVTMVALPCREVYITPASHVYIHMPKTYGAKKLSGVWHLMSRLQKLSTVNTLISIYRHRLGWSRKDVRQMMKDSRRFTPAEAVETHLVDMIMERREFESYA